MNNLWLCFNKSLNRNSLQFLWIWKWIKINLKDVGYIPETGNSLLDKSPVRCRWETWTSGSWESGARRWAAVSESCAGVSLVERAVLPPVPHRIPTTVDWLILYYQNRGTTDVWERAGQCFYFTGIFSSTEWADYLLCLPKNPPKIVTIKTEQSTVELQLTDLQSSGSPIIWITLRNKYFVIHRSKIIQPLKQL